MTEIKESRFIDVVLADPTHKLPFAGSPRLFPVDGERVDGWDPLWIALLADGSVRLKTAPAVPPASPDDETDR